MHLWGSIISLVLDQGTPKCRQNYSPRNRKYPAPQVHKYKIIYETFTNQRHYRDMKKAQIEELEYFVWECPYKKCQNRNETHWCAVEELKNGKRGAECEECGRITELII